MRTYTTAQLIDLLGWNNLVNELKVIFHRINNSISSFLTDAPSDGNIYGRKDEGWEEVLSGGLQPGDNISELLNDSGYLTASDVNPDLQQVSDNGNSTTRSLASENNLGNGVRLNPNGEIIQNSGSNVGNFKIIFTNNDLTALRDVIWRDKSGSPAFTNELPTVLGNYADDSAAGAANIPVGGLYHTAGVVKIRLT